MNTMSGGGGGGGGGGRKKVAEFEEVRDLLQCHQKWILAFRFCTEIKINQFKGNYTFLYQ